MKISDKISKIFLACLITLLLFCQTGVSAQDATPISTLEDAQNSVWEIADNLSGGGTAFPIASNVFVTNYHVIVGMGNSSEIRLSRERTSLTFKRLLAVSALYDLAIFETQEPVSLYFEVIGERPEPDEDLFTSGYPKGRFEQIQKTGDLIHYENYDSFPVDRDKDDIKGASGSPIFNRAIHVVGVLKSTANNVVNLVRGAQLKELMEGKIGLECGELIVLTECVKREVEALKTTAAQGNAYAQERLAHMYFHGQGIERDLELAFFWYHKAAEQGDADAQNNLAWMYKDGEVIEKNLQEAFSRYKTEQGFDLAQHLAFFWYHKAAEQGDHLAQYNLAGMYQNGQGVERNLQKAFDWYHKAAEQGNASAQFRLAQIETAIHSIEHQKNSEEAIKQASEKAIKQASEKAIKQYQKAAEQGLAAAQNNLAWMYQNGKGIEKNRQEAFSRYKTEQKLDLAQYLAFFWYHKAAEQGYTLAQYNLAWMYQNGEGIEKNPEKAIDWYRKAAEQREKGHAYEQGYTLAQFQLAGIYKNLANMYKDMYKNEESLKEESLKKAKENFGEAIKWYRKAAEQGHVEAQFQLAGIYKNLANMYKDMYKNEESLKEESLKKAKENFGEAIKWYRKAAEQGHVEAQFQLAWMYLHGEGVEKPDFKLVFFWYHKAAEQGYADAQYNLALMYVLGEGVEQNLQEAFSRYKTEQGIDLAQHLVFFWYHRAAEQGLVEAQYNLAGMYKNGQGVERNLQKAFDWYHKAAEQKHAKAQYQYNLALMYKNGEGVEPNSEEALKWYRRAAEKGHAEAQFQLANMLTDMYKNREGGEQSLESLKEAREWYHKAAEQRHAEAQFRLALMYEKGQGGEKNLQKAFEWVQKAAEQGYAGSQIFLLLDRLLEEVLNQQEEIKQNPQPLEP